MKSIPKAWTSLWPRAIPPGAARARPSCLTGRTAPANCSISLDSKLAELAALSAAIAKHAPKDALILAWWDTSRQINLLSGRDTLFTSHIAEPLIVPVVWRDRMQAIGKYEDQFWGAQAR